MLLTMIIMTPYYIMYIHIVIYIYIYIYISYTYNTMVAPQRAQGQASAAWAAEDRGTFWAALHDYISLSLCLSSLSTYIHLSLSIYIYTIYIYIYIYIYIHITYSKCITTTSIIIITCGTTCLTLLV